MIEVHTIDIKLNYIELLNDWSLLLLSFSQLLTDKRKQNCSSAVFTVVLFAAWLYLSIRLLL